MKISREIKVAILVLSGIALFIYLFSFLSGEDIFSSKNTFYTEFDYNALTSSSYVTVKGNKVGKVEDISYQFSTGKTKVEFSVDPQLQFSKNSIIRLYETGLMGGNALEIVTSDEGEMAVSGDFIASEVQEGLISSLKKNFSGLSADLDGTIRTADTLMTNINKLVVDESEAGIKATLEELNKTLKAFRSLSANVQTMIRSNQNKISSMLANFETTSANLKTLSDELKAAGLTNSVKTLDNTLLTFNEILKKVGNPNGTIGKLLNDDALYNNMESASKELDLLLLDIKLHPARYRRILSKKEIPYQKPTEDQLNNN